MLKIHQHRSASAAVVLVLAGLLIWPAASVAQLGGLLPPPPPTTTTSSTVLGSASAVQATVLGILGTGTTTVLADTGTLGGTNDSRDASMDTGSIPSTLDAETLSTDTISWVDEVDSEASLANLNMTVAGIGITADSVMARASQVLGAAGSGSSTLSNLAINGTPIAVTGDPNQTIWVPGGQVIINEQKRKKDRPSSNTGNHGWWTVGGPADAPEHPRIRSRSSGTL